MGHSLRPPWEVRSHPGAISATAAPHRRTCTDVPKDGCADHVSAANFGTGQQARRRRVRCRAKVAGARLANGPWHAPRLSGQTIAMSVFPACTVVFKHLRRRPPYMQAGRTCVPAPMFRVESPAPGGYAEAGTGAVQKGCCPPPWLPTRQSAGWRYQLGRPPPTFHAARGASASKLRRCRSRRSGSEAPSLASAGPRALPFSPPFSGTEPRRSRFRRRRTS